MITPIDKPRFTAVDLVTLKAQIAVYLYKLTDCLEIMLKNIDTDNLSPSLVKSLNALGVSSQSNAEVITASAQKLGSLGNDTGYLQIGDSLICYGSGSQVTFPKKYAEAPTIIATPNSVSLSSTEGFEADETVSYIAVGKAERMN